MLYAFGLRHISGIEPPHLHEYDDVIRVMYFAKTQELQLRFRQMIDAIGKRDRNLFRTRRPGSYSLEPSFMAPRYLCR